MGYHVGRAKCTGCARWVAGVTPSGEYTKWTDGQGRCASCVKYDKPVYYDRKGRILPDAV